MNDPELLAAIAACLNGSAFESETKAVESWLNKDPRHQAIYTELAKRDYQTQIAQESAEAKERIFYQVEHRIHRQTQRRRLRIWQCVAAASIVALLAFAGGEWLSRSTTNKHRLLEAQSPKGARSQIVLGDGTRVSLNAGSTLHYPVCFDKKTRTVSLTGEAYFEVAKDANHPFVVEAGGISVNVLGTHFNVRCFENDNSVVTTLLEGSVKVNDVVLKPNQQLIYDKATHTASLREVDAEQYVIWKDGQYYFDSERFANIINELERGFGIKITIQAEELKDQTYSGIFTAEQTLYQILEAFKKHRSFNYHRHENEIRISSQ
ncbi:MAG: FecR domain-containing protein [Dysgonamonadaceae bacterium]|jgi:ferric-dicitrate binding protein FerR (iron transport regulator)|nr:FecR domain-containing protein [Dysgonamonadaceae bacterium]